MVVLVLVLGERFVCGVNVVREVQGFERKGAGARNPRYCSMCHVWMSVQSCRRTILYAVWWPNYCVDSMCVCVCAWESFLVVLSLPEAQVWHQSKEPRAHCCLLLVNGGTALNNLSISAAVFFVCVCVRDCVQKGEKRHYSAILINLMPSDGWISHCVNTWHFLFSAPQCWHRCRILRKWRVERWSQSFGILTPSC